MTAFVPAIPRADWPRQTGLSTQARTPNTAITPATLPPSATLTPLSNTPLLSGMTTLSNPGLSARARGPLPLAASLRDPADHTDPAISEQTPTPNDRADTSHPLSQLGRLLPERFRPQPSAENTEPSDTPAILTSEVIDPNDTYLTTQVHTNAVDPNIARLPIPGSLGNLLGGDKQNDTRLNNLTLEAPWQRPLRDKEMMTFLKLGLLSRFVYQKLAAPHHPAQIEAFEKRLTEAGYALKTVSVGDNLWGLIAHRDNEVMLCFRGTAFWDDMWRNIQFWPSLDKTVPENETTHHGMSHVFEQLWPKIDSALADIAQHTRRPLKVHISGHSLGGSFAKLTALRLSNKQLAPEKSYKAEARLVCTFGAPKTFFTPSAKRYRELGLDHKTITITQHQDIVPELPPNFLSPYETVGNRLYITRDGALWYKPENGCIDKDKFRETPDENGSCGRPNRWVSDHVLDSYLLVLAAHKQAKLPKPLPPGCCPTPEDQMIKLEE